MKPPGKLVLVYNADDGLFNAIAATVHRVFSPATYECHLCLYTHNIHGMILKWKHFLESLHCSLNFYYRREFRAEYPLSDIELPAILIERGEGLELLLSAHEIKTCADLDELMLRTRWKLGPNLAHPPKPETQLSVQK